jgi:hypothetical protein
LVVEQPGKSIMLIPAYQPGESLIEVVRTLSASAVSAIEVVDDGSGLSFRAISGRTGDLPGVGAVTAEHHPDDILKVCGRLGESWGPASLPAISSRPSAAEFRHTRPNSKAASE